MRTILTWCTLFMLTLAGSAAAAQAPKPSAAQATTAPVNVNTATQADLEALPDVGPATAKKIIAGRPYTSAADLTKAGVPKATVDKIAGMVTFTGAAARTSAVMPSPAPAATTSAPPAASGSAARTSAVATNAPITAQQPPVRGMVWVNLETKVFHREGDRYYGKTKSGKFMNEADAVKAGYREAKAGAVKPSSKP
jgi:hypothetical protein